MTTSAPSPRHYQCLAIAIGLETWAKHKLQVNRTYTPKAMMLTAENLTGKKFKPRDYLGAAKALRQMIETEKRNHFIANEENRNVRAE